MIDPSDLEKYDLDFLNDDELDAILDIESAREEAIEIAKLAEGVYVPNPVGVKNFGVMISEVLKLFKNQPVDIRTDKSEIAKNMGYIIVDGESMVINNPKEFVGIFNLSSGFEIYSDLNGVIHLDFMSEDVAMRIEGGGTNE